MKGVSVVITVVLVLLASYAASALKRAGASPEQKNAATSLRAGANSAPLVTPGQTFHL